MWLSPWKTVVRSSLPTAGSFALVKEGIRLFGWSSNMGGKPCQHSRTPVADFSQSGDLWPLLFCKLFDSRWLAVWQVDCLNGLLEVENAKRITHDFGGGAVDTGPDER